MKEESIYCVGVQISFAFISWLVESGKMINPVEVIESTYSKCSAVISAANFAECLNLVLLLIAFKVRLSRHDLFNFWGSKHC
jgi:hypothetical protein